MKAIDEKMKYCEKHKQEYMAFLPQCPICRGEALDGSLRKVTNIKTEEGV